MLNGLGRSSQESKVPKTVRVVREEVRIVLRIAPVEIGLCTG
jgi:hypothetical protein